MATDATIAVNRGGFAAFGAEHELGRHSEGGEGGARGGSSCRNKCAVGEDSLESGVGEEF